MPLNNTFSSVVYNFSNSEQKKQKIIIEACSITCYLLVLPRYIHVLTNQQHQLTLECIANLGYITTGYNDDGGQTYGIGHLIE